MDIDLSIVHNEYFREKLKEYFERLFQLDKEVIGILLFGSISRNEAVVSNEKISDIDVVIIFANGEIPISHRERTNLKVELMGFYSSHIDSIWMTEQQFKKAVKNKMGILLTALNEGKILYDPKNLIVEQKEQLFKKLEEKGVIKRKNYWIWPLEKFGDEIEW